MTSVLDLDPIGRAACAVGTVPALRHKTLKPEIAGLPELVFQVSRGTVQTLFYACGIDMCDSRKCESPAIQLLERPRLLPCAVGRALTHSETEFNGIGGLLTLHRGRPAFVQ